MRNHKQYEHQTYTPSKGGDNTGSASKQATDKHEPVQAEYLEVKVYNNFEKAMKAFRTLVQKEKVLSTYKEKRRFEKRSDKKRRKKNEMRRKRFEFEQKKLEPKDHKNKSYKVVNHEQSE